MPDEVPKLPQTEPGVEGKVIDGWAA